MSARVWCADGDRERRELLARVAGAAGGTAVPVATVEEARRERAARTFSVVVGAGAVGHAVLAQLAAARHAALRIAVVAVDDCAAVAEIASRVRPFAMVTEPIDPARLEAAIGAALAEAPAEGETSQRFAAPSELPDFERLTVDRATGVYTAPYLRLRLSEEVVRARRYARPLALGLLDIDGLRAVADEAGPQVSARLLRHVGEVLQRGARTVDLVGRWAAGSFAVLLPETIADSAWGICERLRGQVAATPLSTEHGPVAVRLSAGLAVQASSRSLTTGNLGELAHLIARADAALWRAKREGGDRTVADD